MRSFILAAVIAAAAQLAGCDRIEEGMFQRGADRAAEPDREDWLRDGALHVVLCGTGSPIADPDRAAPCTAVIAADKLFLVDVGPGSWENIQLWRLPRAHLASILLTHFHSDHIGDLGEATVQSWIGGRTTPLSVIGPTGVAEVVGGFRAAYGPDSTYRVAHHGADNMPPAVALAEARPFDVPADGSSVTVYDADGLTIRAFAVAHEPVSPAVGYRFEYKGRSVVISGDTKKSANLIHHAKGADLLVHEALSGPIIGRISAILGERGVQRLAKLTSDILDYHTTPVEAAESAREAGVRQLVLTHLVPPPANRIVERVFMAGTAEAWDGPIVLGADGMWFRLPGGSTEIVQESL